MVSATDLKIYKTTNNLGGAITGTQIPTATPNNLFSVVPINEQVVGEDYYACVFLKNTHGTEAMDNFKLWLSDKSFPRDTEIKWGFEPNISSPTTGYRWSPYGSFDGTGSGVISIADDPAYNVDRFTIACWFRTTEVRAPVALPAGGEGFMIAKGSWIGGGGTPNLNYAMWHSDANRLRGGFEESDGTNHLITSTGTTINDGLWHHGCFTYDGANLREYLDGVEYTAGPSPHITTAIPNQSSDSLVIGDNPLGSPHLYFKGDLDEVYIWERAISAIDVAALHANNTVNPSGLVYSNHFGADDSTLTAQTIANKYTAPVGITWNTLGSAPTNANVGQVKAGTYFPVWIWYHVNANAISRIDDNETFSVLFDIPPGGTGTGGTPGSGGGGGGNPPPTPIDYKIAVIGDEGCEPETDDCINLIQNNNYDFVVSVGDHAYESAGCWTGRFDVLKPNFISAMGNHEYSETGGTAPYKSFFGITTTYFTFKFQNIFFLVLDDNDFESGSAPSDSVGSAQYNFIKSELERTDGDGTITWRIAVTHHPWFGKNAQHPANEGGQVQAYHSLFTSHGVSFLLHGHNHHFERSHQVSYNSSDPRTPTIVDSSPPYVKNNTGLISVDSGAGGHDSGSGLYSLPDNASYWAYLNRTHNGIWEIVASNSGQTLTCSFVDTGGSKLDTFVITAA